LAEYIIGSAAELNNIRLGKQGEAKLKMTMRLGKDLFGSFAAQDTRTMRTVSIDFDTGSLLHK